jgi:peptidyl-prolyl cis-trans isomerase A (cyclophilin A)
MRGIGAPALVAGVALAVAASAHGQAPAAPPRPGGEVAVRLATALGNIDIAVDTAHAPVTAGNFLRYVDAGLYDGGRFYRVTRPDNYTPTPPNRPIMNLIEGDIDPTHESQRFPKIPLERTSVTGLTHVVGTVSMGRNDNEPDSAASDFFILLDDQPSLDFGGRRFTDAQGAAAFGHVVAGLDVVRTIQQQGPLEEQNRQHLVSPVTITSAKRR